MSTGAPSRAALYLAVAGFLVFCLFPIYWALVSSLETGSALFEVAFGYGVGHAYACCGEVTGVNVGTSVAGYGERVRSGTFAPLVWVRAARSRIVEGEG